MDVFLFTAYIGGVASGVQFQVAMLYICFTVQMGNVCSGLQQCQPLAYTMNPCGVAAGSTRRLMFKFYTSLVVRQELHGSSFFTRTIRLLLLVDYNQRWQYVVYGLHL